MFSNGSMNNACNRWVFKVGSANKEPTPMVTERRPGDSHDYLFINQTQHRLYPYCNSEALNLLAKGK